MRSDVDLTSSLHTEVMLLYKKDYTWQCHAALQIFFYNPAVMHDDQKKSNGCGQMAAGYSF